jgi:hypothetical protein
MSEGVFQGSLFSSDFLQESISRLPDWSHFDDAAIEALRLDLRRIFDRFPTAQFPNESQTEDDLIWPILTRLGWTESLRQQNLAPRGREDVPDGLSSRTTQRRGKPTPSRRSEGATNSAWPSSNRKDGEGRSTISGHDGGLFALSEQERCLRLRASRLPADTERSPDLSSASPPGSAILRTAGRNQPIQPGFWPSLSRSGARRRRSVALGL